MALEPPTEKEFNEDWIEPGEALDMLVEISGDATRKKWLRDRLETGLIPAVARNGRTRDGSIKRFVFVPPSAWKMMGDSEEYHFWSSGDAVIAIASGSTGYGDFEDHHYFEVRFHPWAFSGKGLVRLPTDHGNAQPVTKEAVPEPAPSAPKKAGAPRKGWWDDLWIEVLRRVADGRLNHETASSGSRLEYVLIEIAQELGFSPGESTLKPMALKLFKYLREIGGK